MALSLKQRKIVWAASRRVQVAMTAEAARRKKPAKARKARKPTRAARRRSARAASVGSGYDPFDPRNYRDSSRQGRSDSYVDLDITVDSEEELQHILEPFGLKYKVLEWDGPAGGNPFVRLIGDADSLRKFMAGEYEEELHPIKSSRVRASRPSAKAGTLDDEGITLDADELIYFAKAYRDLGHAVSEQLDDLFDGPEGFEQVNSNAIQLIESSLGGFSDEIDDVIADYNAWLEETGGDVDDEFDERPQGSGKRMGRRPRRRSGGPFGP